jgi:hypothetical protein
MRFLAFDLEIASVLADFINWRAYRPVGICCAAAIDETGEHRLWFGRKTDGTPAPRMLRHEAADLLAFLAGHQRAGRMVVTWNGANFDFDVLGEESANPPISMQLAREHVDLMVVFGCVRGHQLSLGKAARACGSWKGAGGIATGDEPPVLWANGEYDRVLSYVTQDAKATASIARTMIERRGFTWTTVGGSQARFELPPYAQSLDDMTVEKALNWPPPAYSWSGPQFDRAASLDWTMQ